VDEWVVDDLVEEVEQTVDEWVVKRVDEWVV
jgi:hypothetical protein